MNLLSFTIPGDPVAKGRPKLTTVGGMARAFTPKKTRNYEALVKLACQQAMAGKAPFDGPLGVGIVVCLGVPDSWSRKKRAAALSGEILPTKRPDLDNFTKAVLDGMNAVGFVDDSRIVYLTVRKKFSNFPSVEVSLFALDGLAA